MGDLSREVQGTRVTFNDHQLTPVSFLTHGAGSCWDDQGSDLFGLDWPTSMKNVDDRRMFGDSAQAVFGVIHYLIPAQDNPELGSHSRPPGSGVEPDSPPTPASLAHL